MPIRPLSKRSIVSENLLPSALSVFNFGVGWHAPEYSKGVIEYDTPRPSKSSDSPLARSAAFAFNRSTILSFVWMPGMWRSSAMLHLLLKELYPEKLQRGLQLKKSTRSRGGLVCILVAWDHLSRANLSLKSWGEPLVCADKSDCLSRRIRGPMRKPHLDPGLLAPQRDAQVLQICLAIAASTICPRNMATNS